MKYSVDYAKGYWAGIKALSNILIRGASKSTTPRDDIYYLESMAKLVLDRQRHLTNNSRG